MCRGVIVGDEGCVLLINAPTLHSFGSKSRRQLWETHTHTLGCLLWLLKGLHTWRWALTHTQTHAHMLGLDTGCESSHPLMQIHRWELCKCSCFHQLSKQHKLQNQQSEQVNTMQHYLFIHAGFSFGLEHKFNGSLSVRSCPCRHTCTPWLSKVWFRCWMMMFS